ncbi:hypothetical protein INQ51_08035 [Maribellus sp. CM-23]|uniref:hypothetical protein n=1 Tax=Maribellus sp. CM-23 TaxID=2781026 RepID=UPI001F445E69|nr:hypothetical protein [Maribellus sp. CM-23]MCE4564259.1 hypothetical protein [Maribellus sp. CM-23]
MKRLIQIIAVLMMLVSCNGHNRKTVVLNGFQNQETVIYKTSNIDYYLGYDDLVNYCKKEDNGEPNDFTFRQIIDYLESYSDKPVLIPDTLGTKLEMESKVLFTENDSLIRIRDQEHPYAYLTGELRWIIIDFAKKGKMKIHVNEMDSFVDTIIVDRVENKDYGETNLTFTNDSIFFSQLRWIR